MISEKITIPRIINNRWGIYEGNLRYYLKTMMRHARNLAHPYHNLRHMLHVTYECHDACIYYQDALSSLTRRKILIAALFHDFDHSGLVGHDDLNIERAIRALRKYIHDEDRPYLEEIESLITPTQFPYVQPSEELSLAALIPREADVTQTFSLAWIQQIILGLSEEMGITWRQMFEGQESFLRSMKFRTKWAQEKFSPLVIEEKIEEVRDWIEILNGD